MVKIEVNYEELMGKIKISPLVGIGDFLNKNFNLTFFRQLINRILD